MNPDNLNATSNAFQSVLSRITSVHQALDELKKFQFLSAKLKLTTDVNGLLEKQPFGTGTGGSEMLYKATYVTP